MADWGDRMTPEESSAGAVPITSKGGARITEGLRMTA